MITGNFEEGIDDGCHFKTTIIIIPQLLYMLQQQ